MIAPPGEDLADLVAFRLGHLLHFLPFLDNLAQVEPPSSPRRGVGDGPHGNRLRPERGQGRDQDDPDVAGRRRQAQDDPQDVDDPVLAPEDKVGQDRGLRVGRPFPRLVCVYGGAIPRNRYAVFAGDSGGTRWVTDGHPEVRAHRSI